MLIVAIDDEMVRQEGKYPLSRGTLARIIDEVAQFSPKAVALDILLLDAGDEAEDMALTEALARNRSVIAGAAVFDEATQTVGADGGGALARVPIADSFVLPLDRFSQSAAIGIVNVSTDYAGTPRLVPMVFRSGRPHRVLVSVAGGVGRARTPSRFSNPNGSCLGTARFRPISGSTCRSATTARMARSRR